MKKYTFEPLKKSIRYASYREEDLRRMTLLQLRDICTGEGLVDASLDRLDIDELIQKILHFRGSRERFLINEFTGEGLRRLQSELKRVRFAQLPCGRIRLPSKISLFEGLDTGFFDDYRISRTDDLDGVNALVVDSENAICATLRVVSLPGQEDLFLTRSAQLPCKQSEIHDYRLLLFPQKTSDQLTQLYMGDIQSLPGELQVYSIPLLTFEVCQPLETDLPLAIDFGTTNTAAGVYISKGFFTQLEDHVQPGLIQANGINYLHFLTPKGEVVPLLPTVIGVDRIAGDKVHFCFGFAAEEMAAQSYIGAEVCVFYDIKRWVAACDEWETLSDSSGKQKNLRRKDIVKEYLDYIVHCAEQRFKCRFRRLFLSYPVKQRERFVSLYREILPSYDILEEDMFDEGIAVLYNIIGGFLDGKKFTDSATYQALILDCGGGTTDQSSAAFRIHKGNVAYEIDIETAYENGDTDFGGNNLTFRIMQLLKIQAAHLLTKTGKSLQELAAGFSFDLYRAVDDHGSKAIYAELEQAYAEAEKVIPTRYKEYEYGLGGRDEYYKVYNNFYYLFSLAEGVKKAFFENDQILRIVVTSDSPTPQPDTIVLPAQRWKLAARLPGVSGGLSMQKHFPAVSINTHQVRAVFKADIYDIFRRFVGRLYTEKTLSQYKIVKLTGQSCKIELFRDALKEYVPGVLIRQGSGAQTGNYQLKLACLEGAIRYLRDKSLGYTRVTIRSGQPALPYVLSAETHSGEIVTLIHSLDRSRVSGTVSRNIAGTEVELTLRDTRGNEKYVYSITCNPEDFEQVTYDRIGEQYDGFISQSEVDAIENGEVRYFVWADAGQWGFSLVPVARRNEELYLGRQQLHSFENESWMINYFDGKH